VRGELRLKSFTAEPMAVADYGVLETEDGLRRFELLSARPAGEVLVVRLAGIADRNAAEALTGALLYVPRERLPAPDEDEFYHADLIGLAAETPEGEAVGRVIAVQNFGAGDLVEIAVPGAPSLLVPFTREVVPDVDVAGGRLVVVVPVETD